MSISVWFITVSLILCHCQSGQKESEVRNREKLGDYVQLSLSVIQLDSALSFYQKLGFQLLQNPGATAVPWAMLTSGDLLVMLSQNPFPSPALTYYGQGLSRRITLLRQNGVSLHGTEEKPGERLTAVITTPEKTGITLIDFGNRPFPKLPPGHSTPIGSFSYLALPAPQPTDAVKYWEKLGFTLVENLEHPFPAHLMSDGLCRIGLTDFPAVSTPSLIYHTLELGAIADHLAAAGISFLFIDEGIAGTPKFVVLDSPDRQKFIIGEVR